MKKWQMALFLAVCLLLVAGIYGCAPDDAPAAVEDTDELRFEDAAIQWDMESIWAPSITLWRGERYFVEQINRLALGELYIDWNDGGTLITEPGEMFDAVREGVIDMGSDWPSYWEGRHTAFGLVTSTPMVLTAGDYMLWYWQAGGLELVQELYDQYDLVWFPHSVTSPEAGQRTNVPIEAPEDFAGLSLRQCGRRQADILEGMGAGAIFMAGADLYLALDRGTIDGAEFSVPEVDYHMGLHEVTDYLVVPGWHQPGPVSGIMINKNSWEALPERVKYMFKESAMSTMMWAWTYFEYSSIKYQQLMEEEGGVEVTRLDDDVLSNLQELSWNYLIEDAEADPLHAKIAFSQVKYLYDFQDWRAAQSPFMIGRNPEGLDEAYYALEQIAQDHGVYDEVIELEASVRERMEGMQMWELGTEYQINPITP